MRIMPYILCLSFFAVQLSAAMPLTSKENGLWTQLCASGTWIKIGGGGDDQPPVERPNHMKACHAICCSDDEDDPQSSAKKKT